MEEELELLDVRLVEHQIQELTEALDQMQVNLTSVYQYRDKKKELEEKERRLATIVEDRNTVQLKKWPCGQNFVSRSCKSMKMRKRRD